MIYVLGDYAHSNMLKIKIISITQLLCKHGLNA